MFWGTSGVILGNLLPWIDSKASQATPAQNEAPLNEGVDKVSAETKEALPGSVESSLGADWTPAVRSIGAFVGIAFAIVSVF